MDGYDSKERYQEVARRPSEVSDGVEEMQPLTDAQLAAREGLKRKQDKYLDKDRPLCRFEAGRKNAIVIDKYGDLIFYRTNQISPL